MSEIQLFRLHAQGVEELAGEAIQIEKSLQTLFERNLEALLGVQFLASEYSTGPVHGGRIDTLGVDEDGSPVIIEYKRSVNENVINQGLFYLDWLMDHKGDFELLVLRTLGATKEVDWSSPRLLCIAGDFTRYDSYAVNQITRNIELLRYKKFGTDLLLVELVHSARPTRQQLPAGSHREPRSSVATAAGGNADPYLSQRLSYRISKSDPELIDVYEAVKSYLQTLGDDVQVKELKYYLAFKKIKNFACLEIFPQASVVFVYLKIHPKSVMIEESFTRDMTGVGHMGTGDLQVALRTMADFERAKQLFERSYQES